jgi:hypothetical protein
LNRQKTLSAPGRHQDPTVAREFFLDDDGILYRRKSDGKHQLIVPESLIREVINENDDPVYVSHPGTKRTHDLIALRFWWRNMKKSIEEYVRNCDSCQRRKGDREFVAPLGQIEEPVAHFAITAMDITGSYLQTP